MGHSEFLTQPRKVILFGNGLSLCFNDSHYRLEAITERIKHRLSQIAAGEAGRSLMDQVEEIDARLARDRDHILSPGFEDIAGPIDRLASLFSEITPLVGLADPEHQDALRALGQRLWRLYKRVVGAVLEAVMDHADQEGNWQYLFAIAERLYQIAEIQGSLDVFVLNYDALLDAAILEQRRRQPGLNLLDEFRGHGMTRIPVLTPRQGVAGVGAFPWRDSPWSPSRPFIRLHHLHGSGTWMRYRGTVFKAEHLQLMRSVEVFSAWAEGTEEEVEPVVILGDQKGSWILTTPFNETYYRLAASLAQATEVIIAGYGFGDEPLNAILREHRPPEASMTIINPGAGIQRIARVALGVRTYGEPPPWLLFDDRALPDGFLVERTSG